MNVSPLANSGLLKSLLPGGVRRRAVWRRRAGLSSLDYVLLLGVVLPVIGLSLYFAPRIMNLVYRMTVVLVSWPFS